MDMMILLTLGVFFLANLYLQGYYARQKKQ